MIGFLLIRPLRPDLFFKDKNFISEVNMPQCLDIPGEPNGFEGVSILEPNRGFPGRQGEFGGTLDFLRLTMLFFS
jgi:hypothetical protein